LLAGLKVKEALPEASVVTSFWPMYFFPSSPEGLEKNWTVKVFAGVQLRLALTVVAPEVFLAEVMTGLFCSPLGPESTSPGSLAVLPAALGSQ